VNLVGPATVVSDACADKGQLSGGQSNGLAVVVTLNGGELLGISVNQVGKLQQQATTVDGGGLPPYSVASWTEVMTSSVAGLMTSNFCLSTPSTNSPLMNLEKWHVSCRERINSSSNSSKDAASSVGRLER
jgi:hypothetical protein